MVTNIALLVLIICCCLVNVLPLILKEIADCYTMKSKCICDVFFRHTNLNKWLNIQNNIISRMSSNDSRMSSNDSRMSSNDSRMSSNKLLQFNLYYLIIANIDLLQVCLCHYVLHDT